MKKLIDFDGEYMRFAAARLKDAGELSDAALQDALNESMRAWLNEKADWLGGLTPDAYFSQMDDASLVALMRDYCDANMDVPEPLYYQLLRRLGIDESLGAITMDASANEAARSTALRILCDTNAGNVTDLCISLLVNGSCLTPMAAQWLTDAGYDAAQTLLKVYDGADEAIQEVMLDVLCYYPGIPRTAELLADKLLQDHEHRAQHAAMAARLGDPALIEPLQRLSKLSELSYYDYKEIVNAIDSLGGEMGEERQFSGDPDYELMRDPDISNLGGMSDN